MLPIEKAFENPEMLIAIFSDFHFFSGRPDSPVAGLKSLFRRTPASEADTHHLTSPRASSVYEPSPHDTSVPYVSFGLKSDIGLLLPQGGGNLQ